MPPKKFIEHHKWNDNDDAHLRSIIGPLSDKKPNAWGKIALKFNAKTGLTLKGKQCRERWVNHLRPGITKRPLLDEEKELIYSLRTNEHKSFEKIAGILGISGNHAKNTYHVIVSSPNFPLSFFSKRRAASVTPSVTPPATPPAVTPPMTPLLSTVLSLNTPPATPTETPEFFAEMEWTSYQSRELFMPFTEASLTSYEESNAPFNP